MASLAIQMVDDLRCARRELSSIPKDTHASGEGFDIAYNDPRRDGLAQQPDLSNFLCRNIYDPHDFS